MLEVPGDLLEGGGQIVRTTIALSALTGKPVRLTKIRDKRPNPGLQAQHVVAVKAVAAICNAETTGITMRAAIRSTPTMGMESATVSAAIIIRTPRIVFADDLKRISSL